MIADLGQRALGGHDLQRLLDDAATLIARTLHVEYTAVLELSSDGEQFVLRAGSGWNRGNVGRALLSARPDSPAGYALKSGSAVLVDDLAGDTRFSTPALLRDHKVVSGVTVMISGVSRPFGALGAYTMRRRPFSADAIHFVQAVANLLGVAIERLRAEAASEARLRMSRALTVVAAVLVEVRDTHTVAQRIVDEVRGLFGAVGALLCRLEPRTDRLEAIAVSGDVGPEYSKRLIFAQGVGTPGLAAMTPTPVITANLLTDPRITLPPDLRAAVERAPFRTVLALPLLLLNQVVGTLCILDREGRVFSHEDTRVAQAFAHHAALALENARLYEAAEAARAEATAANRAKDAFLAVLSHELRAPLNAVFGWTRMLRTGRMDKRATERALEAIERNSVLQGQLIDDLLDISRIIMGKLELALRPVSLPSAITDAVESIRPAAESKNIALGVTSDVLACTIEADPLRLHQIMTNLLSNAIKFTPRNGQVTIALARYGRRVRITVRDTGPGIDPELLPHVFERFRQGHGTPKEGQIGLGLGLAIVHHLVELHGGAVTAQSEGVGRGAAFTVELPIADGRAVDTASRPPDHSFGTDEPGVNLAGTAVLLVEDDADTRELTAIALQEQGADVRMASSVAQALAAIRESPTDVLISDLRLPDGDGYELIHRMRNFERHAARAMVPAIALTGFAGAEARHRALAAGYQAYVVKPIDPYRLIEAVAKTVAGSRRTTG